MNDLRLESKPELRAPVLIMAFRGWNDAGNAATHAVEYVVEQLGADRFGAMDPDEFYDFTQARPHTRPVGDYRRELTWPENDLYSYRSGDEGGDLVFFVGTEPHLRWRRYGANLVQLAQDLGIREVMALGALLADAPHTRPVPLSGGASTPEIAERLKSVGIHHSRYEGPTGILGVVGSMLADAGIPNGSMWASVPHYISATPNPKASAALVRQLGGVLPLSVGLARLEEEAETYQSQIESALVDNPEAQQYVRELELRSLASPDDPDLDLPPQEGFGDPEPLDASQAEGFIRSVEEFLRRQGDLPGEGDARS